MRTAFAGEALELAAATTQALQRAGGMNLVRESERDPGARDVVAKIFASLGIWDLQPRERQLELEAAAAVCRVAGRYATPYPVAERLARPGHGGAEGLLLVEGDDGLATHGDLPLRWAVVRPDGTGATFVEAGDPARSRLGFFATRVRSTPEGVADIGGAALLMTLQSWVLIGLLGAVLDDTLGHVKAREQFGKRLADMQGLQFALTDAVVALTMAEDLAKYTTWRLAEPGDHPVLVDALSLRAVTLESAETVLRIGHQLHGAMGFCYETDVSWLSRHSHPLRRLPFGRAETEWRVAEAIEAHGFDGLHAGTDHD